MKILSVVGARPNFMKLAPIVRAIQDHNARVSQSPAGMPGVERTELIQHFLVHTGQHYDAAMSGWFFTDLGLPAPDIHLGVGSSSHAVQTAEIMQKFEAVLLREKPDMVIVIGDVNSTLACSLVASKVAYDAAGTRPLISHIEAGLRSFDRTMPEEINRIVTDHLADLLFVTEESGQQNLINEGIGAEKIHFVGNTMIDSLLRFKRQAEESSILDKLGLRKTGSSNGSGQRVTSYALLTLHRPSNVDNRETFLEIVEGLSELASAFPIVFPVHPRTLQRIKEFSLDHYFESVDTSSVTKTAASGQLPSRLRMIPPLGYLDFLSLMGHARLVLTDSGGIQEETTCLGIPCVTVRENTERPVTMTVGTNVLGGTRRDGIREAIRRQLASKPTHAVPAMWDGRSAARILEVIKRVVPTKRSNVEEHQASR